MILERKACNSEIRNRTRKTDTKNVRPGVVKVGKSRPKNKARKNEARKVKPVKRAETEKKNKKKNNFIQARILATEEG